MSNYYFVFKDCGSIKKLELLYYIETPDDVHLFNHAYNNSRFIEGACIISYSTVTKKFGVIDDEDWGKFVKGQDNILYVYTDLPIDLIQEKLPEICATHLGAVINEHDTWFYPEDELFWLLSR